MILDPLRFEFTQTLSIQNSTIGGLILRAKASKGQIDRDIMFQLEYYVSGKPRIHLWRVDFRPFHNHDNDPIGQSEFHYLSFTDTHSHDFFANYVDSKDSMLKQNLPIAVECDPKPLNFHELLDFCGVKFSPPYSAMGGLSAGERGVKC